MCLFGGLVLVDSFLLLRFFESFLKELFEQCFPLLPIQAALMRTYMGSVYLHNTHTHKCSDLSEVRSHGDRSRGMSQGC